MTVFDHPLWPRLAPHARLTEGRDNLDLLQLPDDLRAAALLVALPCVACGKVIRVFRARMKSGRSRVSGQTEERRLFYAGTCPSYENSGCARSRAAKEHKRRLRERFGVGREGSLAVVVRVRDASGQEMVRLRTTLEEELLVDLPWGACHVLIDRERGR